MQGGREDWFLRPWLEGLLDYRAYYDPALSLEDIQAMNDALDVKAENEARARKAAEKKE